jgi:2-polyprenyl-3-methyl-5-hydroxy-6-metoxy-1,4-benzoquinol methylase
MAIDEGKLEQFLGQIVTDMGAAGSTALVHVGERLGLYRALVEGGAQTSAELATRTELNERLVREWLANQAAGGYVGYNPATATYTLSEEQAFVLADPDSPVSIGGLVDVLLAIYADLDKVIDGYRTGKGLHWHEHDHRLFTGTERFFRPGYAAHLVPEWIPALDGVDAKLTAGAKVADVGCGHGASTVVMAKAYPGSTFEGWDYHAPSIEAARKAAAEAGVTDRATFETGRAQDYPGSGYDLVCLFDCLHDMGDPVGAARHIKTTLAPGGSLLLVEPNGNDTLEDNINPVGRLFYAASATICTPNGVAQGAGADAMGAQAGEARTRAVFTDAGWSSFRRATETPFNIVYEARP